MSTAPDVTTADLSDADSTTTLLRCAIGPVNTKRYLPVFARFEAADRVGASWNWAAGLCTLNWMAYRQLWSAALAYAGAVVGVVLLVFGIGRLVFQFSEGVELGLLLGFGVAAFAVPGIYGNALLYAVLRKKMAAALASNATLPEACAMLTRRAPSRRRLLLLGLINVALAGVAVAAYLEFPQAGILPPGQLSQLKNTEPKTAVAPVPVPPSTVPAPAPVAATAPPPEPTDSAAIPPPTAAISPPLQTTAVPAPNPTSATSGPVLPATLPVSTAAPTVTVAPTATTSPPPAVAASAPVATPAPAPVLPAAPAPVPATATAPAPAKIAEQTPVVVAPIEPKAKAAKPAVPKAKVAEAPAKKPTATTKATSEPHFYVDVGLFKDPNNALNAYVKLTDAGLPALKKEFTRSKGKLTRVRVGPLDTEGEAQTAAEKVRVLGLDAIILRPPEKPAPSP